MRRGFTLVEMLVAIAVIAILAALLFPTVVKAQMRAQRTACASNMRQIGAAVEAYAADWDQHYPAAWNCDSVLIRSKSPSLLALMQSYTPSKALWACPSDIGETDPQDWSGFRQRTPPFYKIGPGSYEWPGYGCTDMPPLAARPTTFVHKPAITPLLYEGRPWHRPYPPNISYWKNDTISPYNVCYCDGHIGFRTAPQMLGDMAEAFEP